jgi:hypothetical protein
MNKATYYFSHDFNARNDEKIMAVRIKYGMEGYGIYFALLERLGESSLYIHVKDYNIISFDLRVSNSLVKSIIEDFGLFEFTEDGKHFHSVSFNERMKPLDNLRGQRSDAGKKSAEKRKNSPVFNDRSTTVENEAGDRCPEIQQRKGKERKEEESNPPDPLGEDDFSDFKKTIEKVTIPDDAKQARGLIAGALSDSGFDCSKEFRVENRGDGKRGKIDIYASKSGLNYAIEINGDTLRQKSVFKLGQVDGAFKIILLRSGKTFCVQGIDWVYSFGIEKGSNSFDFSFIREDFKVPFNDWLEYKRSKGQMYNTQRTLQECYSHMEDISHGDAETAKLIVKRSMANNWAGIFELKNKKNITEIIDKNGDRITITKQNSGTVGGDYPGNRTHPFRTDAENRRNEREVLSRMAEAILQQPEAEKD